MCIQNSISHIHWQSFEDEKEESVDIGDVNFHNKSCCVETLIPKRDEEPTYEYNA